MAASRHWSGGAHGALYESPQSHYSAEAAAASTSICVLSASS